MTKELAREIATEGAATPVRTWMGAGKVLLVIAALTALLAPAFYVSFVVYETYSHFTLPLFMLWAMFVSSCFGTWIAIKDK